MSKVNHSLNSLPAISIIIPTLNEAGNLPILFKRIDSSLNKANITYEIIVIDDNSTDNTFGVSKALSNKYDVKTFTKKGEMGKAYSLLEGFALASNDIVCMIDADLQYPPEEIANMCRLMEQSRVDIVITERVDMRHSYIRKLSTKVFNGIFAKWLFGIDYDTQSGLKLFKKQVLKEISVTPSPWSFDLEFIVRSLEAGFSIVSHEIPFYERHHGQPKLSVLKVSYELSLASIKLRKATSLSSMKHKYKKNLEHVRSLTLFVIILGSTLILGNSFKSPSAAALSINSASSNQSLSLSSLGDQINNLLNTSSSGSDSGSSQATSSQNAAPTNAANAKSATSSNSAQVTSTPSSAKAIDDSSTTAQPTSTITAAYTPIGVNDNSSSANLGSSYRGNKLSSRQTRLLEMISAILVGTAVLMFVLGSRAKDNRLVPQRLKSYKLPR
jgi:glycosyltransferase involved in cell wall biosynthesis